MRSFLSSSDFIHYIVYVVLKSNFTIQKSTTDQKYKECVFLLFTKNEDVKIVRIVISF